MIPTPTLSELVVRRLTHDPARTAILEKRNGVYQPIAWAQLADDVYRLAAALRGLGIQPGDRVATYGPNRYEWLVGDLALLCVGAVHVPVQPTHTPAQFAFQVRHSGARAVFLTSRCTQLLAEFADARGGAIEPLPDDFPRIFWDEPGLEASPAACNWRPWLAAHDPAEGARIAQATAAAAQPDDLATIMYTSGTTGEPRGVMLTQGNLAFNAQASSVAFRASGDDVRMAFLPWSHIYARTCDVYCWLVAGSTLAIAESRETILADCQQCRPTFLNGVPYFYARVMKHCLAEEAAGRTVSLPHLLGGRIESCCCGGAALPPEVFDFFHARGIKLLEGYGLTESSPVIALSTKVEFRRGSVGRPLAGTEVAIAEDGEILARGPHIMAGYWNDPAATAAVLREGWLHTGDLGRLDEEGYLYITGRKKELIVLETGKKAVPSQIEALLTTDPLILQAVVVGDGRSYLTALIVPDPELLRAKISDLGLWVFSRAQALSHPTVVSLYAEIIREKLRSLAHHEQIGRFRLMDRGFTIETGEMTAKLSLRRAVIQQNCAELIEELYRG